MGRYQQQEAIAEVCATEWQREESARERAAVAAVPRSHEDARAVAAEQAEDEGLWFPAQTVTEAHLQAALRRLAAAVESAPNDELAAMTLDRDTWRDGYMELSKLLNVPEC